MNADAARGRKTLSDDAIRLGGEERASSRRIVRFSFLLVVFMRIVAGLWMLRGLLYWQDILAPTHEPFEGLPPLAIAEAIFFSVADLLAAVGLWFATPWGGVLWLFAAAIGLVAMLVAPHKGDGGHLAFAVDLVLIVAYFVLSWHAANEREDGNES